MSAKIIEALRGLDVNNINHWTTDGQPRLDTVRMLAADQSLSRDAVIAAAPGFTRANASTWTPPEVTATQAPESEPYSPRNAGLGAVGQPTETVPAMAEPVAPVALAFTVTAPEQPEMVTFQFRIGENGAQTLEEALAEAKEKTVSIRDALDKLTKMYEEAQNKEAQLQHAWEKEQPAQKDSDAIQAYLAAQRKRGEERAARQALIAESGIDLKALARDLRSPLDSAMARKNFRGTKRPGE